MIYSTISNANDFIDCIIRDFIDLHAKQNIVRHEYLDSQSLFTLLFQKVIIIVDVSSLIRKDFRRRLPPPDADVLTITSKLEIIVPSTSAIDERISIRLDQTKHQHTNICSMINGHCIAK